jgi:hypothetical protein
LAFLFHVETSFLFLWNPYSEKCWQLTVLVASLSIPSFSIPKDCLHFYQGKGLWLDHLEEVVLFWTNQPQPRRKFTLSKMASCGPE